MHILSTLCVRFGSYLLISHYLLQGGDYDNNKMNNAFAVVTGQRVTPEGLVVTTLAAAAGGCSTVDASSLACFPASIYTEYIFIEKFLRRVNFNYTINVT